MDFFYFFLFWIDCIAHNIYLAAWQSSCTRLVSLSFIHIYCNCISVAHGGAQYKSISQLDKYFINNTSIAYVYIEIVTIGVRLKNIPYDKISILICSRTYWVQRMRCDRQTEWNTRGTNREFKMKKGYRPFKLAEKKNELTLWCLCALIYANRYGRNTCKYMVMMCAPCIHVAHIYIQFVWNWNDFQWW